MYLNNCDEALSPPLVHHEVKSSIWPELYNVAVLCLKCKFNVACMLAC